MEYYDNKNIVVQEKYLKDLNAHLPSWVKKIVDLYTSEKKYKLRREI